MDELYREKLERAAEALDSDFPDLLWDPLVTDFSDRYFRMDLDDANNVAVRVDPRFTTSNLNRIRTKSKNIAQWLEWISIYDAYIEYILDKYGTIDFVEQLIELGEFEDPVLHNWRIRPKLKKGNDAKLVELGFIPSFRPPDYTVEDMAQWVHHILDLDPPDVEGQEEPDIQWAMYHDQSEKEKKMAEQAAARYRKNERLLALTSGARSMTGSGVWGSMDWVNGFYGDMESGRYDTQFSYGSGNETGSIVAQMKRQYDLAHETETQKLERIAHAGQSKLYFDGSTVNKRNDFAELLGKIAEVTGINMIEGMSAAGASKREIKAIRTDMQMAGVAIPMTDKERKRMEKKIRKQKDREARIERSDSILADVLKSNRILMNAGTIRFEDGRRYDD